MPLPRPVAPEPQPPRPRAPAPGDVVRSLPVQRDDRALFEGLRAGEPWARAALFDRYAGVVERMLRRVLGNDRHDDLADLVQETFVQALTSLHGLRDGEALLAWMQTVAARTAYRTIRARRARRWLRFWEPEEVPEVAIDGADPEVLEACKRAYAALERLPADERVAFALRFIDGMELERIAAVTEVSLATVKRRLSRAEDRFCRAAERDEVLQSWLHRGGRWGA